MKVKSGFQVPEKLSLSPEWRCLLNRGVPEESYSVSSSLKVMKADVLKLKPCIVRCDASSNILHI